MRSRFLLRAAVAVGILAAPAYAQQLGGVGSGISSGFTSALPSQRLGRSLGREQYATGSQFFRGASTAGSYGGGEYGYGSAGVDLRSRGWRPLSWYEGEPSVGTLPTLVGRVRTIDSLQIAKRARFARLRQTTLALAERVRNLGESGLGQLRIGLRKLMFPFPLQDRAEFGYGFFSQMDLVGGGPLDRELFLAPFTDEVQQSLGEEQFLDVADALLFGRTLPPGMSLDTFYDTQLAAMGNYLFNNGRYGPSAEVWAVLVERDPTSAVRHRALALSLLAERRFAPAAEEVRQSFALAPGWPDRLRITGSNLQDVFPSTQDLVEVREELQAQLTRQPDDADLALLMGFLDLFQGREEAAEQRLTRLADRDQVAAGLAALLRAGAVDDTVKRPMLTTLRRVAEELTGLEEPALSDADRERLIEVLEGGAKTYEDQVRLGDFRFFMGDFTLAAEEYRAAGKAKPDDAFALFALVHASFACGEYRTASRYLDRALALEPNWGLYEFRLQEFYGDDTEYRRHVQDLERLTQLRPGSPDRKFLLAYVYYFSGRYADASDLLAEVLRLRPDFHYADQFLRLARLQG